MQLPIPKLKKGIELNVARDRARGLNDRLGFRRSISDQSCRVLSVDFSIRPLTPLSRQFAEIL
jgi:hypothetical protein